jgi:DNA invertase Pin-like site-specific DNA recombinase
MEKSNNELMHQKVVGYIRVSSEEQVENYSLDNQEKYIKEYCDRYDKELIQIFKEEGKSAKTLKRPELLKCLNFCKLNKQDISALVVYRIDRLSRDTSDYLAVRKTLADYGIDVFSVTEPTGRTPTDKFLELILSGVAELDNSIRGMRAQDGLKARFMDGWFSGKCPLGYMSIKDKSGRPIIVPNPDEFSLLQEAWIKMASGSVSLRDVAKWMNKVGLKTKWRGGKKFKLTHKSAGRIFNNKFYTGYLVSKKWGEVRAKHEPMIDENIFYKVQEILYNRNTNKNTKVRRLVIHPDFPLRKILFCTHCGKPLTGSWSKGKMGKKYGYYFCLNWCDKKVYPISFVNEAVVELLKKITPNPNYLKAFLLMLKRDYEKRRDKFFGNRNKMEEQVETIKWKQKQLIKGHMEGRYSDSIFDEMSKEFEHEMIAARTGLNESIINQYQIEEIINFSKVFMTDLSKPFIHGTPGQVRILLSSIFPKNLIMDNGVIRTPELASFFTYLSSSGSLGGAEGHKLELSLYMLQTLMNAYPDYKQQFAN